MQTTPQNTGTTGTKQLSASAATTHFGFYDATLAPVLTIDPGEEIVVQTVSADPSHDVPRDWLPSAIDEIVESAPRGTGPHILTGPIAVRGLRPGDLLQVDILEIRPTRPYGYNIVSPLKGLFPTEQPRLETTIIPIDLATGLAQVTERIAVPIRPFFGQLGVAPPPDWGRIDSRPPNRHGGNIDNKELVAGTRLFLPVHVEGALFSLGDGHAAQGDGEINQTAIETSLDGRIRLSRAEGLELDWPAAVTPTHLLTMAFHDDLMTAARIAARALIALLERHAGLTFHEAYRLASIAADLRVTQVVNGNRGIHAMLPRSLLAGHDLPPALSLP